MRTRLGASGQQTNIEYDLAGNPTQRTDALGRTTRHTYDALNRLVETMDPRGGRTALDYDVHDRITRVVDARGVTTTYTYNAFGDLLRESSPDAGTRIYTYDGAGNRIAETDARGITRTFSYDALNRLTGVSYPDPVEDVRFTYDQGINGTGRLSTIEDASGSIRLGYNVHGEVVTQVRETEGLRFEIRYNHDPLGRVEALRYPSGAVLRLAYGQGGRVSALSADLGGQTLPLAEDIAYTAFGVLASLQLANGIRTERHFDVDGRLQEAHAASTLHLDLGYDPVGNIVALTDMLDATRSQAFDYDELDRLVSALGAYGFRDYDYDGVGNRLSRDSDATQERYDYAVDNNRLLSVTDGSAPRQYMYDENGNTLGDGRFSYTYSQANRLVRVAQAGTERARYTYNALGQRTRKTLPGGGVPGTDQEEIETWMAFHESEIDRLNIFVDELLQHIAAAEAQAHAYDTEANAARQTAEQAESDTEIHRQQVQDHETQSERLKLMAAQFRVLLNIAEASGASRSYIATLKRVIADHDRLSAHYQDMAEHARVEAGGLDAKAIESRVMADHADAQAAALLDEAGRLRGQVEGTREAVLGHAEQVEYWAGRLTAPDHGDGVPSGGVDTHFVYDLDGQLIGEYDSAGEPVREYIYLQGMPLVMLHAGEIYYYHTDHLGTPARITDTQQRVVWDAIQSPFGSLTMMTEVIENPLRFPGQYQDRETGRHYNYFRDFDPQIGRYIESDPIGIAGGLNTYLYAGNNPIMKSDPLGLVEWEGSATGGAVVTVGLFTFNLQSECINGPRGTATVVLAGPGIGAGLFDFSFSFSDVKLRDPINFVDPLVFNDPSLDGGFIASAGISLGVTAAQALGRQLGGAPPNSPTGFGCAAIRLGDAGGSGCGGIRGVEVGAGVFVGSSTVLAFSVESCVCEMGKQ